MAPTRAIPALPLFLLAALLLSACSVVMAAKQPGKKDLSIIKVGTTRTEIITEFGAPVAQEIDAEGRRIEHYLFVQGYSTAAKTGRAVFHGVADVFTLGLWEIVGTPTEAIFDGTAYTLRVVYDVDDKVQESELLKATSK